MGCGVRGPAHRPSGHKQLAKVGKRSPTPYEVQLQTVIPLGQLCSGLHRNEAVDV